MDEKNVNEILSEYSEVSLKHYKQIKRYIFLTWIYLLVATGIFAFGLLTITNANYDLAETIQKRSPVLDYLQCHNELEDSKSLAQTDLLLSYMDARDDPTPATNLRLSQTTLKYEKAVEKLINPDSCRDFPE